MAGAPPDRQDSICLSLVKYLPLITSISFCFPGLRVTKSVGLCSEGSKPSLRHVQGANDRAQLATKPDDLSLISPEPVGWKERTHSTEFSDLHTCASPIPSAKHIKYIKNVRKHCQNADGRVSHGSVSRSQAPDLGQMVQSLRPCVPRLCPESGYEG